MSFSSLINSLWNSKSIINKGNGYNNSPIQAKQASQPSQDIYSQGNINNSVPISQGKEYIWDEEAYQADNTQGWVLVV